MSVAILALNCCFFVLHTSTSFRSLDWLKESTDWKLNSSPSVGQCWDDHQDHQWDCPSMSVFVTGTSVLFWNILWLCPLEFLWHLQYNVIVMIHRLHILSWQRFEFLWGIAVQRVLLFNKLVLRVETSSWCDEKSTMVIKRRRDLDKFNTVI